MLRECTCPLDDRGLCARLDIGKALDKNEAVIEAECCHADIISGLVDPTIEAVRAVLEQHRRSSSCECFRAIRARYGID